MKIATAKLKSASPYSQSRFHETEEFEKEGKDAYEKRTWAERLHYDRITNEVFIPPMAFKNCLTECAKFLGVQIPGKGKSTYTKHFEAGVLVTDPVTLATVKDGNGSGPIVVAIKKEDAIGETFFVPVDGVRGSGKRVKKTFPMIASWNGTLVAYILDDTITKDVFLRHLEQAGQFIGVGRFRPRNNGFYGRFDVVSLDWQDAVK